MSDMPVSTTRSLTGSEIAIVGMAGRFPGAATMEQFWINLRDGVESIRPVGGERFERPAVGPDPRTLPGYVDAAGVLDDVDGFDAPFFNYTPAEVEIMDPQHRLFLECAWEALEDAGCVPDGADARIGVFAGARADTYIYNLVTNARLVQDVGPVEIGLGHDAGFLTSRVSHRLGLTGPSYAVHTACSTSLVAVHLACQSLLIDECRIALAGGVSVMVPHRSGYLYQRGGIVSSDGHCRPFDARAAGTVFTSGIGVVALKRLEDALEDGDRIHAVILGSAINNDGAAKAGFTAPAVDGQADVIAEALASADVRAESISYVEAHGTGTPLGDPIEVRALTRAFNAHTTARGFCALGSVKGNIGHLDAAAGIAGLIKTVLAMTHRTLPPTVHFIEPNPQIDFDGSPFIVQARATEWTSNGSPRRAGISSFGVGGTNAHVILEEAPASASATRSASTPAAAPAEEAEREWHVLTVSARSEAALGAATDRLAAHLLAHPDQPIADVACTLQTGRRAFAHRRIVVCRDTESAAAWLERRDGPRVATGSIGDTEPVVTFLLPGQGAQYPGMGAELYASEATYREHVDACAHQLRDPLGFDIREVMHPDPSRAAWAVERLLDTAIAQPALFTVEYALAQLWRSWGVEPRAMIGHSLGEYVAACLADVLSLEDALRLVQVRGALVRDHAEPGVMLAVALSRADTEARLASDLASKDLWLAAVNGASQCVVAGREEAIAAFEQRLAAERIGKKRLASRQAFHSGLMDAAAARFVDVVRGVRRQPPRIPYVSSLTGRWVTAAEVQDPEYWGAQLRQAVDFDAGMRLLLQDSSRAFVEVGPGRTLMALGGSRRSGDGDRDDRRVRVTTLGSEPGGDAVHALTSLGRLWIAGVPVRWHALHGEKRRRVGLPTYPFERQRYWIDARPRADGAEVRREDDWKRWTYLPGWTRTLTPERSPDAAVAAVAAAAASAEWLIFEDAEGLAAHVGERLAREGASVIRVRAGEAFSADGDRDYTLSPADPSHYDQLFAALAESGRDPRRIAHFFAAGPPPIGGLTDRVAEAQRRGFHSLVALSQALARVTNDGRPCRLWAVTSGMQQVIGGDQSRPETASVLGPCKVLPQEMPWLACASVDITWPVDATERDAIVAQLCTEFESRAGADAAGAMDAMDAIVALRRGQRWRASYDAVRLEEDGPSRLRPGGVYLITGGLGGVGYAVAAHLARTVQARLAVVGRRELPSRDVWNEWLEERSDTAAAIDIAKLRELEALGAEVLYVRADVSDGAAVDEALAHVRQSHGALHGVIHAAGIAAGGLTQFKAADRMDAVFAPKSGGLLVLSERLAAAPLDFFLVFSSISAVLGEFGQVEYCAANALCDALAEDAAARGACPMISVNWDTWQDSGMAARALEAPGLPDRVRERLTSEIAAGMSHADGLKVFDGVLSRRGISRLVVSTRDVSKRIDDTRAFIRSGVLDALSGVDVAASLHPRPELATEMVPPEGPIEEALAEIWRHMLGLEQVGRDDSFFDLGGHSLLTTRVIARVRDRFGIEFPLPQFFEDPTIAGMAAVIAEDEAGREADDDREILELVSRLSPGEVEAELKKREAVRAES